MSRHRIVLLALFVEGGMALFAVMLSRFMDVSLWPLTKDYLRDAIIGAAGAVPPFLFFTFILSKKSLTFPYLESLRTIVLKDLKRLFSSCTVPDLIMISLLAGIGEELLFRGVIQAKFGIIIASIVFGLAHYVSPAYVIVTSIMGLYIGLLFQWSGSLLVPIQIHFVYDLAALLYLKFKEFPEEGTLQ